MKVLICGGGTAGHVYPGLALAEALKRAETDLEIIFVGSEGGLENTVVPAAGYELISLPVKGWSRRLSPALFSFFYGLGRSMVMGAGVVRSHRPAAVVGMGGFASFPAAAAAFLSGCPVILHEQNAVPGLANRQLSRWADVVALTFPDAAGRFKNRRTEVVGNPIRQALLAVDREAARAELGLDNRPVTLLIFGGSRGARRLNEVVLDAYDTFRHAHNLQVIHVTGMMEHNRFKERLAAVRRRHDTVKYHIFPYIEDMGLAYAAADLVVARAGATTIAEITAVGLPSILVPYPHATDDHQTANARRLERVGAAKVIADDAFSSQIFWQAVSGCAYRPELLREMAKAAAALGRPDAADDLARVVLAAARGESVRAKVEPEGDKATALEERRSDNIV